MPAHIHAALMAEYAKDAAESETPWKNWEVYSDITGRWYPFVENPEWHPGMQYRRKPRTIRIGDMDVPEPMKHHPEEGEFYWLVLLGPNKLVEKFKWRGDMSDIGHFDHGFVHATEEAAFLHATALILISGGTF